MSVALLVLLLCVLTLCVGECGAQAYWYVDALNGNSGASGQNSFAEAKDDISDVVTLSGTGIVALGFFEEYK